MPQYVAQLSLMINVDEPADAAVSMSELLSKFGVRDIAIGVLDPATGTSLGTFDGYGEPVDVTMPKAVSS